METVVVREPISQVQQNSVLKEILAQLKEINEKLTTVVATLKTNEQG